MRVFEGLSLGAVGRRPFLANRARLGQVAGASLEEYFEAATNAYDRALRAAALAESGDAAGAKKIYDTDPDNAIFWRDTALGLLEDLAAKKAISEADRKEILESVQIPIGDIVAKAGDALARGEIRFWQVFSESAIDRILELVETVKNFAVTRWNRNAKVYNAIVDYIQTATATIERLEKPPSISKDIIDKLKADVGQWKKVKTTIDDSIVAAGLPIEAAGGTAEPMPGSVEGIGYLGPARQSLKGLVKLISGKAGIRTPAGKMVVEEAVEETGKAAKKITTKTLLWKAGAGVLTGTGLFTAGVIFHMSGAGSFLDSRRKGRHRGDQESASAEGSGPESVRRGTRQDGREERREAGRGREGHWKGQGKDRQDSYYQRRGAGPRPGGLQPPGEEDDGALRSDRPRGHGPLYRPDPFGEEELDPSFLTAASIALERAGARFRSWSTTRSFPSGRKTSTSHPSRSP